MSIVNYDVSKHYAGSQVSDCCPLGYLFQKLGKMSQNLSAAAVVIGALRVKYQVCINVHINSLFLPDVFFFSGCGP